MENTQESTGSMIQKIEVSKQQLANPRPEDSKQTEGDALVEISSKKSKKITGNTYISSLNSRNLTRIDNS